MAANHQQDTREPRRPLFARTKETCERYKIARATLWRWVKDRKDFPKPIKAGARVTLFDLNAIDAYLADGKGGA
jgi:predicted DNA-binding transcriptional regulator AlpA